MSPLINALFNDLKADLNAIEQFTPPEKAIVNHFHIKLEKNTYQISKIERIGLVFLDKTYDFSKDENEAFDIKIDPIYESKTIYKVVPDDDPENAKKIKAVPKETCILLQGYTVSFKPHLEKESEALGKLLNDFLNFF